MDIENIITADDFGEPYAGLVYKIGISNTIKFATKFCGRQISFKKLDAKKNKNFAELVELLDEVTAIKIVNAYAGEKVYFPEIKTACKKKIKKLIIERFDGSNHLELAKEFGYSERHIYRILKEKGCKHSILDECQLSLFNKL